MYSYYGHSLSECCPNHRFIIIEDGLHTIIIVLLDVLGNRTWHMSGHVVLWNGSHSKVI